MADYVALALEILHVISGVAWIGAVFYSVVVLRRALPGIAMPARKETIRAIVPVAVRFIPMIAFSTIFWGALLYLWLGTFNVDVLLGSRWGQTILVAFVVSLVAFATGILFVIRTSKRILGHLEEEACAHQETVGALQRTMNSAQIVVLALGIVVIALMVMASQRV